MQAIVALAEAVRELSKAISSVNVQAVVSNNIVRSDGSGAAISIMADQASSRL